MSSPRGGSPGAEQQEPTDTPALTPDGSSTIEDTDTTSRIQPSEATEARREGPPAENDLLPASVATIEHETRSGDGPDADRLASQLSLLDTQLGSLDRNTSVNQDQDAGSSLAAHPSHPALPPPPPTSHAESLQQPIDLNHSLPPLNHSLPPTPREEHPDRDFGSSATRSERRRSTVSFREGDGEEHVSSSSRNSAARDYHLGRQASFPEGNEQAEFALPRWQPDAEVTYCPICQTQFSIFVRKHHCRKCGRVVCNSCSPHRIIIPHQYIVRPPGTDATLPRGFLYEGFTAGYGDLNGPVGGERVRLCNPCVPDPQTAPPQSPGAAMGGAPGRSTHQRSRSSFAGNYGTTPSSSRYPGSYAESRGSDQFRRYSSGTRSITMAAGVRPAPSGSTSRMAHHGSLQRLPHTGSSYPARHSSLAGASSSSRNRMLPPTPQIAEEDECPICHRELPPRELPNFEAAREAHIASCIQSHSTYGSPRVSAPGSTEPAGPSPPLRRTGMYKYIATEKDCIDDAECTICLEEFTVGVGMARLECLCRFHRSCISAWFVNHPGRCPVHQHDGFGF